MANAIARLLVFLGIIGQVASQSSLWTDVCTAEEYVNYKRELCPDVFRVSSLFFNPLYPKTVAHSTLILQPTRNLPSVTEKIQYVHIKLPGFEPVGTVNTGNALFRDLTVTANNPTAVGENTATAYNTVLNPIFKNPGKYQIYTGILELEVDPSRTLRADKFTELIICCFRLPPSSPKDAVTNRISAPTTSLGTDAISVSDEPIKSTPYIDAGFQWDFLMVQFDPPTAKSFAVIQLTVRPANDLKDRCRIILHTPSIVRVPAGNADIDFNTAASGDPNDWMFFAHLARWDDAARTVTFFLRAGKTLAAGKQVTLSTNPGEFLLPIEIVSNWDDIRVEARSADGVDEIIRPSAVSQSSHVPHLRFFTFSEFVYYNNAPGAKSDVDFTFRTNRPMFAGTKIFLRLSGFSAEVIEVPLRGDIKHHFQNERAKFYLPENLMEFHMNQTLYCNEVAATITLQDLILPPALYANDSSLLIWNSDPDCERQPIMNSPEVGGGVKTFTLSKITFTPQEPRRAANITFALLPTIVFFQGDEIVLHLYGFLSFNRRIPLTGPGASRIRNGEALWYAAYSVLVLIVAPNQIISNQDPLLLSIDKSENFRIPDKLTQNDGILRVEGKGALIYKEPVKKVPALGDPKYVIDSRIVFEPVSEVANSVARITFTMILNCDVLPNSTIRITLGGILRAPPSCDIFGVNYCQDRTAKVALSGKNAPLFVDGVGDWSQEEALLTAKIVPTVQIYAGEMVRFFLERDQYFKLPYAAYPSDPSFRLSIPEAGVPEQPFNFSTRVNQEPKGFAVSEIFYGDRDSVAYPNTVVEMTVRFRPNVNLPEGSIVRIMLPGFTSPLTSIPISSVDQPQNGELYISTFISRAKWDQLGYMMTLEVPPRKTIYRQLISVMRIMATYGFRLPSTPLLPNDPQLTIASVKNQIIFEEPVKSSPRVVDRTFLISEFDYLPPQKESIFLLTMKLQPTVNITYENEITIELPGFRNSLSKRNIQIMGTGRYYIADSMAAWNETTSQLKLNIARGREVPAFVMLDLRIEESQGFFLPASLNANDTRILISSKNNIEPPEPIKNSPMIGNRPYSGHKFCMFQYERGVRTSQPICPTAADCLPPLEDPCSPAELERCGCETRLDAIFPLTVTGFNLQPTDLLSFVPYSQLCSKDHHNPSVMSPFTEPYSKTVSVDRDSVQYNSIMSIDTGVFRMCVNHVGLMFDIGFTVVRPSCRKPLVMVHGACVEYCPKTKIPIAGECRKDPTAFRHTDNQAYMVPVAIGGLSQAKPTLDERKGSDPELRYFIYRFTYELAKMLSADANRIEIASLYNREGKMMVSTVFTTVGSEELQAIATERTPLALISLLGALQKDQSSILYQSTFFKDIDRTPLPAPVPVRQCPDSHYRVFCPYTYTIMSGPLVVVVYLAVAVVVVLIISLIMLCCWLVDRDRTRAVDEDLLVKLQRDPRECEPDVQIDYAQSWLDGRFMGENWEKARSSKFLALDN